MNTVAVRSYMRQLNPLVTRQLRYDPHPYLVEGMRVRVTHGPLAGVEGILITKKGCDRAIPSPNRLTERFAYKIKRLPKNVALLYSPGSHANELDAGP